MDSVFDFYSFSLMLVSIGLFVVRYLRDDPPIYPYLIIACTCYVGNVLGEAGGGIFAMALLVAASFSFLGALLFPTWRNMSKKDGAPADKPAAAKPAAREPAAAAPKHS